MTNVEPQSDPSYLDEMAEKKDMRIQLVMSPSELEELDAWRATRRIWSRSEAIRRLISEGIGKVAESPDSDNTSDNKRGAS
jgi:metal-responsive CopG/Arc/MetJ family transcriptional regulator